MDKNLKLGILIGILFLCCFYLYKICSTKKIMKGGDDHIDPDNPEGFTDEEAPEINFNVDTKTTIDKDTVNCNLEQIKKNNNINSKWVYYNGIIYDLTPFINTEYINVDENILNTIQFLKINELQDLSKFLLSIENYNKFIREHNTEVEKNMDLDSEENNLLVNEFKIDNEDLKEKIFNKFKFIFIKSITQFKLGIICPSGLQI